MNPQEKERLIQAYLQAYNNLDVEGMMEVLEEEVLFENFSSGEKTHALHGKKAFQGQALEALSYFSSRKQTIQSIIHLEEKTEIEIAYWAIAAVDFPNGIKKGQEIRMEGKSIFEFGQKGITKIMDIS
ncbi:nuclear transport factor 2 family protein [Algoriphagus confluentis]|uniref:SnoaL-like domain-containing protein n=1 Tax=Algoriphagus confluentis TaxID=1697556 RepID=A0ABQ6PNI8_9BACT|nr:hypothetical protein Aconfl_21440 [Algoriphagus confluentis]